MRNTSIKCLLVTLLCMMAVTSSGNTVYDFTKGGIYYKINDDNETVSVSYIQSVTYSSGTVYYNGAIKYEEDIEIPDSVKYSGKTYAVTEIRSHAFENCNKLTSVTFGKNVKKINSYAFYKCRSLKSVAIGPNITVINPCAFQLCDSLASVTFCNSLYWVSSNAFGGTPWLRSQPDGVVYAAHVAFLYKGDMPANTELSFKEGTKYIMASMFYDSSHESSKNNYKNLISVKCPSSLVRIMDNAFSDCPNLKSVEFNEGLEEIGQYAFRSCSKLETVNFWPKSLKKIGEYAFSNCIKLRTGIEISNNISVCNQGIFNACESITTLSLGANVLTINARAFGCKNLVRVRSFAQTPPTCATDAFGSATSTNAVNYTLCKLIVPKGTKEAYATSLVWKDFLQIEEMDILAEALTLSPKQMTLAEGQTDVIKAVIAPANVDSRTLFWKSTNPLVAAVDEDGKVTGIKPGVAQVVAMTTDGSNLSDTCTVTVVNGKATAIVVSPTSAQMEVGGMVRLTATITPDDAPNKVVQWTSSNEDVAMVSSTGTVYAVGAGSATITASTTDGSNLSASCQVTVAAPFAMSAQSVTVPVNTMRNIPIVVDNHADVKSFKFTVHVPDSIEFYSDAMAGPRCADFDVATTFNADSSVVTVEGVMTGQALASGTGTFVLLPVKSSKYINNYDIRLTDISFTGTNDGVGTQSLPDVIVTLRVLNLGDVNGDKVVDIADVNALINHMLGKQVDGTFNFNLGDLDENGVIDISDVNAVINLMLGKH